ncbi:MAG: hypothetical protein ACTHN5_21450 [Phycisphaerae bacterium]
MDERFAVRTSEQSGLPSVWLSDQAMWDLAQYLASHGTSVECGYGFCENGFEVSFHVVDENVVEKLLDDWRRSRNGVHEAW